MASASPASTAGMLRRCGGSLSAGQAGTFHSASATSGTPTFALPPERSIRQAAATALPPAALIASMHSREDTPVETMSSTISTGWPFFEREIAAQLELAVLPLDIHRRQAQLAAHLIARDDAADRRRDDGGDLLLHLFAHLLRQRLAQLGGALGVLEHQRLLQELVGMQPATTG